MRYTSRSDLNRCRCGSTVTSQVDGVRNDMREGSRGDGFTAMEARVHRHVRRGWGDEDRRDGSRWRGVREEEQRQHDRVGRVQGGENDDVAIARVGVDADERFAIGEGVGGQYPGLGLEQRGEAMAGDGVSRQREDEWCGHGRSPADWPFAVVGSSTSRMTGLLVRYPRAYSSSPGASA